MLSFTRKTDYALVALAFLGQCKAKGLGSASAREIADQFHMPLPQLMNILKQLAKARLVQSTRGATGGYSLATTPQRITILEVMTAMEGPFRLAACCSSTLPILGQTDCQVAANCPIQHPIRRLHERVAQFLGEVTLADLMESKVDQRYEEMMHPAAGLHAGARA